MKDLPSIDAQVCFLIGKKDKAVPPDVGQRAARVIPKAEVHLLENVGHLAHEEAPQQVLSEIKAFLKKG